MARRLLWERAIERLAERRRLVVERRRLERLTERLRLRLRERLEDEAEAVRVRGRGVAWRRRVPVARGAMG